MDSSDLDNISFLLSGARDAKFAQRSIPKCKLDRIAGFCVHEGGIVPIGIIIWLLSLISSSSGDWLVSPYDVLVAVKKTGEF